MIDILKFASVPYGSSNILQLDNPDKYSCQLWQYQQGHSIMIIRLRRIDQDEILYVGIEPVEYIDTQISWSGANFCLPSEAESIDFMRRLDRLAYRPEPYFPGIFRLIEISHLAGKARFVAGMVTILPRPIQ